MRHTGLVSACRLSRSTGRAVGAVVLMVSALAVAGCDSAPEPRENPPESASQVPAPAEIAVAPALQSAENPPSTSKEVPLFDGRTLGQWKATDFGGQGDVHVKDGAIHMEMGSYMTGITWTGPVVRMNYEITLEAMRVQGNDFFCALTFPVGENPCTLVLGGWGGSVCGLSNIDYFDASENETTCLISFKTGTWYHVRLRVVPDRIQAWLDDELLIDFETGEHKIDIRPEVELSQPLGIATWMTAGAVRHIRLETLPEPVQ